MPAGGGVFTQRFTHGLPGGGPIVFAFIIPDVEVATWLIHWNAVETQAQETPFCARPEETIAAGVVGDHSSVLAIAQVIAPRKRRIRSRDHIFFCRVVKETVLQLSTSWLISLMILSLIRFAWIHCHTSKRCLWGNA